MAFQKEWETALELADLDACRDLIKRGADIHRPALIGPTALHFAVSQRRVALAQLLLDCGADVEHAAGPMRVTPLALALQLRDPEMAELLIAAGASLSFVAPGAEDGYLTPFQALIVRGNMDDVRRYAILHDVDLGQRTTGGKTLIQLCGSNTEHKTLLRALKAERAVADQLPRAASSTTISARGVHGIL